MMQLKKKIRILLCSYENSDIDKFDNLRLNRNIIKYYNVVQEKNIILIRNPLNMLASTVNLLEKWRRNNCVSEDDFYNKLNTRIKS